MRTKVIILAICALLGIGYFIYQHNYSPIALTKKAAEEGNVIAQQNLAIAYDKGDGVPQDSVKAQEWRDKAAAQGH